MLGYSKPIVTFESRSGELFVTKNGKWLEMNFPASTPIPRENFETLIKGLGQCPAEVLAADDYLAIFDSEAIVRAIKPDQTLY